MTSSSSKDTLTGFLLDDGCGRNLGLNLPARNTEEMSKCIDLSAKYSKIMVIVLEHVKQKILKKKEAGTRICVLAEWQANGGVKIQVVDREGIEKSAPEVTKDSRLMQYIDQYDMSISVPIALQSRFNGATDFFASVMGFPWMTKEELAAQLTKAMTGKARAPGSNDDNNKA